MAGVGLVSLWKDSDEHGESSIIVENTKNKPDSPQNDQAVGVKHHHQYGRQCGEHEEDLTDIQAPLLVADVVQHHIRQRSNVRHSLMCEGKTGGCGKEATQKEQSTQYSLEWLSGNSNLICLIKKNIQSYGVGSDYFFCNIMLFMNVRRLWMSLRCLKKLITMVSNIPTPMCITIHTLVVVIECCTEAL